MDFEPVWDKHLCHPFAEFLEKARRYGTGSDDGMGFWATADRYDKDARICIRSIVIDGQRPEAPYTHVFWLPK